MAYSREIKMRRSNDVPLRSGVLRLTSPEVPWAMGSAEFSLVWAWSIPIGALALLVPWRAAPEPLSEASRWACLFVAEPLGMILAPLILADPLWKLQYFF